MSNIFIKKNQSGSIVEFVQLQSKTIDMLRFPLAIMVIFIHMNPTVVNLLEEDVNLISGHGIYNVIGVILSHVLTHIAVPTFYFISGLLFFLNFKEWSWKGYKKKMYSRIWTLLIPYILWNAVPFALKAFYMLAGVVVKGYPIDGLQAFVAENGWHIFYDCNEWGTTRINWLGENLRMTGPYDLPLWFLRDLIVVTILTPIIYFAVKKLKMFIIVVLFLAYVSRIWTLVPGFHITAFFYFTLGAYFALNGVNIIQFTNKYSIFFVPTSIVLLFVTTIYDGVYTVIGQNVYPFFICTGVFSAFYIVSSCIIKYNISPNKFLVSSCFFVYAIHGVEFPYIGSPIAFVQMVLHKAIPGNTGMEDGFCYLVSPFATSAFCILLFIIARRIFPKVTLCFSGNK